MIGKLVSPLGIIAIILGCVLLSDFDFRKLTFKNLWLDILYIIVFIIAVFLLFRDKR